MDAFLWGSHIWPKKQKLDSNSWSNWSSLLQSWGGGSKLVERGSLEPVELGRLRERCERLKSEQNLAKVQYQTQQCGEDWRGELGYRCCRGASLVDWSQVHRLINSQENAVPRPDRQTDRPQTMTITMTKHTYALQHRTVTSRKKEEELHAYSTEAVCSLWRGLNNRTKTISIGGFWPFPSGPTTLFSNKLCDFCINSKSIKSADCKPYRKRLLVLYHSTL